MLSPPGNGEDCHRTWESVLLGAIPIVRNSTLWPLYREAPVCVIDDWTNPTEAQFLDYQVKTRSKRMVLAQYWFNMLNHYKALARGESSTFLP